MGNPQKNGMQPGRLQRQQVGQEEASTVSFLCFVFFRRCLFFCLCFALVPFVFFVCFCVYECDVFCIFVLHFVCIFCIICPFVFLSFVCFGIMYVCLLPFFSSFFCILRRIFVLSYFLLWLNVFCRAFCCAFGLSYCC